MKNQNVNKVVVMSEVEKVMFSVIGCIEQMTNENQIPLKTTKRDIELEHYQQRLIR